MFTGKQLFSLYTMACLNTSNEYRWDQLSEEFQRRWNEFAGTINRSL